MIRKSRDLRFQHYAIDGCTKAVDANAVEGGPATNETRERTKFAARVKINAVGERDFKSDYFTNI